MNTKRIYAQGEVEFVPPEEYRVSHVPMAPECTW